MVSTFAKIPERFSISKKEIGRKAQEDMDKEPLLLLRTLTLIIIASQPKEIQFLMEHPEDPERNPKGKRRWLTEDEAKVPCCSFWVTDCFGSLVVYCSRRRQLQRAMLQNFDQGPLGHLAIKPASIFTTLPIKLEEIRGTSTGMSNASGSKD
jgi:hypothetical protein